MVVCGQGLLIKQGLPAEAARRWAAGAWLFNPLAINLSTRGSADSTVVMLVLGAVSAGKSSRCFHIGLAACPYSSRLDSPKAMSRYTFIAGVALGLAIHMKIYPVIYTLAIALHISGAHGKHPCSILRRLFSGQSFIFLTVRTERLAHFYARFTPRPTRRRQQHVSAW